jgi:tetratricopeptide (TPR) repeat protein
LQLGEVQKALNDFDQVVAENPNFLPVYPLRVRIHIAKGEKAAGLADLDAYLAGRPAIKEDGDIHGRRGRFLRAMYAESPVDQRKNQSVLALAALAVDELSQSAEQDGKSPEVFEDLGAMLELSGRTKEGIRAYSKGLAVASKPLTLHLKRAWAYEQVEDHDKAQADFAAGAEIDPKNAEAHAGLGYIDALRKLPAEAQREADLALLHGANDYLILHDVACIYSALSQTGGPPKPGHQDVAMALLHRAVELWKNRGAGPSEIEFIKNDPAFKPLSGREDFQKLKNGDSE